MTKKELAEIRLHKQYLGGMRFEDHATRRYSLTILNTKLKDTVIIMSIYTPRTGPFEWGEQENEYWVEGNEKITFKDIEDLINSL